MMWWMRAVAHSHGRWVKARWVQEPMTAHCAEAPMEHCAEVPMERCAEAPKERSAEPRRARWALAPKDAHG